MYSQLKLNIDRNNKKMKNFDPETTKNCPKVPKSAGVYMAYHTILDLRAPSAEAHGIFAAKLRAMHGGQERGHPHFSERFAQGGERGEACAQFIQITGDDVHHIAHTYHENDGGQDDGHDVDFLTGQLHKSQGAQSTQEDDGQWDDDAPPGAKRQIEKGDQQEQTESDKQRHFALHDAHVVHLGVCPA